MCTRATASQVQCCPEADEDMQAMTDSAPSMSSDDAIDIERLIELPAGYTVHVGADVQFHLPESVRDGDAVRAYLVETSAARMPTTNELAERAIDVVVSSSDRTAIVVTMLTLRDGEACRRRRRRRHRFLFLFRSINQLFLVLGDRSWLVRACCRWQRRQALRHIAFHDRRQLMRAGGGRRGDVRSTIRTRANARCVSAEGRRRGNEVLRACIGMP
jgi:hypothetical protein